jgi:hypothetical protein
MAPSHSTLKQVDIHAGRWSLRLACEILRFFEFMDDCYSIWKKFNKFFCSQTNVYARGHSAKIQKQTASTRQRSSFWSVRTVKDWNSLPEEVVLAPTLNSFKNRLGKHLHKEVFIHKT